jgi:hypothetical protein
MKVFTNKYPVLGMLTINSDNTIDKSSINIEFEEGKVFKVLGIQFDDFILECEGKAVAIKADMFIAAFSETELVI